MNIEVLYFPGCPNHRPVVDLLKAVLQDRGFDATIAEVPVTSVEQAKELAFVGSPSIRINGVDLEPELERSSDFSFSCRTYIEAGKLSGVPSLDLIRRAIEHALQ